MFYCRNIPHGFIRSFGRLFVLWKKFSICPPSPISTISNQWLYLRPWLKPKLFWPIFHSSFKDFFSSNCISDHVSDPCKIYYRTNQGNIYCYFCISIGNDRDPNITFGIPDEILTYNYWITQCLQNYCLVVLFSVSFENRIPYNRCCIIYIDFRQ